MDGRPDKRGQLRRRRIAICCAVAAKCGAKSRPPRADDVLLAIRRSALVASVRVDYLPGGPVERERIEAQPATRMQNVAENERPFNL